MKLIKIKFPDGSFGLQTQDPLTEEEADKLLAGELSPLQCCRCGVLVMVDELNYILIKSHDNPVLEGLVTCPKCQIDTVASINCMLKPFEK